MPGTVSTPGEHPGQRGQQGSGCPFQRAWPDGQFFPASALLLGFPEGESEDMYFFLRSEQSSGRLSTQEAGCLASQL